MNRRLMTFFLIFFTAALFGQSEGEKLYLQGKENSDPVKRITYFQKSCKINYGKGCVALGIYHQNISSAEHDYLKAHKLFQKACDLGEQSGCIQLAKTYDDGLGVKQDDNKALKIMQGVCDKGFGNGCTNLGYVYVRKGGDYKKANQYFKKACDLKDTFGCLALGASYEEGLGLKADIKMAKTMFKKACELGEEQGCHWHDNLTQTNP